MVNNLKIETQRLILKAWYPEDYKQLYQNNDKAAIMSVLGYETEKEYQRDIMRLEGGMKMFNRSFCYFQIILKSDNRTIGGIGLHNWVDEHKRAEIGYNLKHDSDKQKGYMKEAIGPVIDFGFKHLKLHRIEAYFRPNNVPSKRLLEINGFTHEGLLKDHYILDGIYEDSMLYALIHPDEKN